MLVSDFLAIIFGVEEFSGPQAGISGTDYILVFYSLLVLVLFFSFVKPYYDSYGPHHKPWPHDHKFFATHDNPICRQSLRGLHGNAFLLTIHNPTDY